MSDLLVIEEINPVVVFSDGGLDPLLDKITKQVKLFVPDVTTKKGREDIASLAHRVAKSKTFLDGKGKDLVSGWKSQSKKVDDERKRMRDYLDDLKVEVRKPLTEFENTEKDRIANHEANIMEIVGGGERASTEWDFLPIDTMKDRLREIEEIDTSIGWDEFSSLATDKKNTAISLIKEAIKKRETKEAEKAELEALRKAEEARKIKEREESIRLEAENKAKREAEELAEKEAKKAEDARLAEVHAREAAEQRAKQAEIDAKKSAELAAQQERDRIKSEQEAEELAAKKREANKKHKSSINNAAKKALVKAGLSDSDAQKAIVAIAKDLVPSIKIYY